LRYKYTQLVFHRIIMATLRRSARIATLKTPNYGDLTKQQHEQLEADKQWLAQQIDVLVCDDLDLSRLIGFCEYLKKHPLMALRDKAFRDHAGEMLARHFYRYRYLEYYKSPTEQCDHFISLYTELRASWYDAVHDPLYMP
jgi:hypothetical protein